MTHRDSGRARRCTRRHVSWRRCLTVAALLLVCDATAGCVNWPAVLTQLVEARRLGSMLRVQFTKAADASNRAVMEESDEASSVAAKDARRAREEVTRDIRTLRGLLQSLGYDRDLNLLGAFAARFAEYERLDDEILPLAGENTNLKAQRLALGPGRVAAEEFQGSVEAAARLATRSQSIEAALLAVRARAALLEIRVLQPLHIVEPSDRVMAGIEEKMSEHGDEARQALHQLEVAVSPAAATPLAGASAALDRFMALNAEIVALSRRNTNVRSLALALGRKRMVTALCEERLQALVEGLEKHEFTATR